MRPWHLFLAVVLSWPCGSAYAQSVTLQDTAPFAASRLRESSGVIASSRQGVYWSHNDSGDGPFLYATDSAGRDLGRIRVRGAGAVDWEDIGAGPCVRAVGRCLYIADTGDNRSRRRRVTIYRIVEPAPPTGPGDTLRSVPVMDSLAIRYDDGPRDVEAIVVTPDSALLLVSKPREQRPRLYTIAATSSGPVTATDLGTLPIRVSALRGRQVTGGSISPDGRWVVLRTYVSLHFFRRDASGLHPVGDPGGIPIPFVEAHGEAICFDGQHRLILTSEAGQSDRGRLVRLRVTLPER